MKYKILNNSYRLGRELCLLGLLAVLTATTILAPSCRCIPIEPGARLTIENRFDSDVTIIREAIYYNGKRSEPLIMGVAPAGQTIETRGFMVSSDSIGETAIIKAEDPLGNVVWEKSWPYDEFIKLKDVGWKIVVGPETSS